MRVLAAARAARDQAGDSAEAVCVSHQLPIVAARRYVEGRPLAHDPAATAVRARLGHLADVLGRRRGARRLRRAGGRDTGRIRRRSVTPRSRLVVGPGQCHSGS